MEVANAPNCAAAGPGSEVYCNVLGNLLILDVVASVVGTLPAHNIQTHTGPLCTYISYVTYTVVVVAAVAVVVGVGGVVMAVGV